jgi:hypothetical protein
MICAVTPVPKSATARSGTGGFVAAVTARTVWWMLPRTGGATGVVAGWARGTRWPAAGADPDANAPGAGA